MATLLINPRFQLLDANGDPVAGGKVYTYEAGTTTLKDSYTDQLMSATNTNPIILDGAGRGDVWLEGSYKIRADDASDVNIYTIDNVIGYDARDWTGLTATIADLNSTSTYAVLKSADYTIQGIDRGYTILCDTTSNDIVIDLPDAGIVNNKFKVIIKKVSKDNNEVVFTVVSSQTIDNVDVTATSYKLSDYNDFIEIHSDGSNWKLVASQSRGTLVITTVDTPVHLTDEGKVFLIGAASADVTMSLDSAVDLGRGFRIGFKRTDNSSNTVTIDPYGAETIDGDATKTLDGQYINYMIVSDGSNWQIISDLASAEEKSLPIGYIEGLTHEHDRADVTHDTKINVGKARSADDKVNLVLESALVKRIDANWAEGTAHGGFPASLTLSSNTWYFVHLIGKTDGTTDAVYDTSATAANALADAVISAAGYVKYRRIGSVKTDGSHNIKAYYMSLYGMSRYFMWYDSVEDSHDPVTGHNHITIDTPLGIPVNALISPRAIGTGMNGMHAYIYSGANTTTPVGTINFEFDLMTPLYNNKSDLWLLTNTSAQISMHVYYVTLSLVDPFKVTTIGWIDNLMI